MKTLSGKVLFLFLLFLLIFNNISFGATRYWVSAIAGNFNVAGNWSTTSGGAPVGGAPAVGDVAVFDGGGLGNCTFTANYIQTGGGIQITAAYTGTISTSTFNVTFGNLHFSQAGGTFTCGSGTISMTATSTFTLSGGTFNRSNGTFTNLGGTFNISGGTFNGGTGNITIAGATTLSGGIFNSTSGTFTINNSFTKTGGTFNNNSGTFAFGGNATYQINTNLKLVFNNLTFNGTGVNCIRNINSDTLDVNGTLTFAGTSRFAIQNSIIRSFGNINVTNTYTGQNTHTGGLILICGTGNQNFTGGHATNIQAYLPTIQINKTSGTLFFINKICVEGNWRYDAGTLDYTTNANTICFLYGKNFTGVSHNLGNVEFNTVLTTNSAFNLGSIVLTVNGTLTISGGTGQVTLQNSTIHAKGDIAITHTRSGSNSSTTVILINGTANQTITGTATAYLGRLPAVTINKPSGTLFLINNVTIEGNYIYTAGTIDYTTNSNTVCFYGVGSTLTLTGTHGLGNVEFFGNGGASNQYTLTGVTLTVNGNLIFSGTSQFRMFGGTINAKGNLNITNTYNANNSHTTSILLNGTADQTIASSVGAGNGRLPTMTINKSTGVLFFSGVISSESNFTYTAGTVDPQTSNFVFYNTAKTIDCEAASTMEFYNSTLGDASTRTLMGDMVVRNVMALNTGRILLNSNTLTLENGATGALTFSTGAIISENTGNLSKVSWIIGTTTGAHIIPFENFLVFDIPFTFNLTSGDAGTVTISTYSTAANNTPYPVTPQTVTNVNTVGGIDNSANTVNRFWQIDKTGANPVADLTFTYGDNEWDSSEPSNYQAQRYEVSTNIWQPAVNAQTSNPALNQVIVPGVSSFSPWTLATASSPLAIEMMSYDVRSIEKSVMVSWVVFAESDIIEYEIQKSIDLNDVLTIGTVSSGNLQYAFNDLNPLDGISYYRVVAKLRNGEKEFFYWKKADFIFKIKESISIYPNPIEAGNVLRIRNSETYSGSIEIIDLSGKTVFQREINIDGAAPIELIIPENISQGCYILSLGDKKSRLIID